MSRVLQGWSLWVGALGFASLVGCASKPPEVTPPPEPYRRPPPSAAKTDRPECADGEERAGDRCVPKLAPDELGPEGCPKDMVFIPTDTFLFGSPDSKLQNGLREVRALAVCLERKEVTAAEYEACAKAGRCPPPSSTVWNAEERHEEGGAEQCNAGHADRQQHPMNCVSLTMAEAYCWSRGRRLPSELEWEHAARGKDGREYPWGSDGPSPRVVNGCDKDCRALGEKAGGKVDALYRETDGFAATAPTGTFGAGASPYGLLDMSGNVAEWTATKWEGGDGYVVKGGSADRPGYDARCAARKKRPGAQGADFLGYRCCADPK